MIVVSHHSRTIVKSQFPTINSDHIRLGFYGIWLTVSTKDCVPWLDISQLPKSQRSRNQCTQIKQLATTGCPTE